MWELYAMWTWVPVMIRASLDLTGEPRALAETASFLIIGAGAAGCVAAGFAADRWIALVGRLQHSLGWRSAFGVLAIGPALGVVAMLRLRSLPEAARIAQGRR
jgi:hypothetical protein